MVRAAFRLILILVILAAAGAFFLGYWWNSRQTEVAERPVGTSGDEPGADVQRAREAGAEIGETVAEGAERAQRAMADASLTSKIKAKMALDDSVKALRIDVDTKDSIVTLTGIVRSEAERTRTLQLARETDGVASVVDRLEIRDR